MANGFINRLFRRGSTQSQQQQPQSQQSQQPTGNRLLPATMFNMQHVQSTNIRRIGYNAQNRQMRVEFLNGDSYQYFNVDPATYTNVRAGRHQARYPTPHRPSIGSALDFFIKKRGYAYIKE